ncbi:hypothetical protein Y1Q_0002258 [Alligator mississippiensis]|uniref:Uncharacterized protein n=1 Tax=Alligator mississippiensis TaxID=8496 RepID=A0A151MGV9_ALLMI|nr:hypothetical protein Y1Q_0002258 [Alligator mississippiensis]
MLPSNLCHNIVGPLLFKQNTQKGVQARARSSTEYNQRELIMKEPVSISRGLSQRFCQDACPCRKRGTLVNPV